MISRVLESHGPCELLELSIVQIGPYTTEIRGRFTKHESRAIFRDDSCLRKKTYETFGRETISDFVAGRRATGVASA